jgi:cytochrome c-type biogenesis protein CcmH
MMIWFFFVLLTVVAMAVLLAPVLWRGAAAPAPDRLAYDRSVFRDQLAELESDLARGAIAPADAEAARNELSRRLLAASGVETALPRLQTGGRWIALAGSLIVPFVALPLYLQYGTPHMPDVPLSVRLANAEQTGDFDALVAKAELHLDQHPDDLNGWLVLAPSYKRVGRWADAARAYGRILDLRPPTAETIADYGEMLVYANQGLVSSEAARAFAEALKSDPQLPKARYFNAVGLRQEGKLTQARAALEALLADTPPDAPWRKTVVADLKDLHSAAPALGKDQMAAGDNMSAADRAAMIRSMVDGLEEKLKSDPANLEGWQRLIRSRTVLGETDKAKAALATARQQFKDAPDALATLDGLAKELDLL